MIYYYPSNIQGTLIRNAITGNAYENCFVGSKSENNFFKVIDSTGNYDEKGKKTRGNVNPNKLFFEDYDEFKLFYKINEKDGYEFLNNE
tara:strand:+ start:187 stop:453 length:267 start_codon:yes stop_codon:yes gene_type:complete